MGRATSEFNFDPGFQYANSMWMSVLGAIALLSSWMQITLIAWYSDGMSRHLAVNYFKLCLSKDGSFFDKAKPDKIARKL
jgi:hypothetical protein